MFHRFGPTIRVYRKRHQGHNFSDTINCLIVYDVELVRLQNCYLGFSNFEDSEKNKKILKILYFRNIFLLKTKFSKKHAIC